MFSKTMEFCNKGMVWADPLPPSYGQRPYFYIFFLLDPSLRETLANVLRGMQRVWGGCKDLQELWQSTIRSRRRTLGSIHCRLLTMLTPAISVTTIRRAGICDVDTALYITPRNLNLINKYNSSRLCAQYSTVQYSTVHYSTVQYSTVQYSTVQYSTVQYSTIQYSTVQYSTVYKLGRYKFKQKFNEISYLFVLFAVSLLTLFWNYISYHNVTTICVTTMLLQYLLPQC